MADDEVVDFGFAAAGRLYDLAVEYSERSHAAQAELVRAFERDVATIAGDVGEIVVEDDEEEHLVLTVDGQLTGRILTTNPTAGWEPLTSPDDVVDFYDPVDLFDDLADAIAEAFPGVAGQDDGDAADAPPAGDSVRAPTTDPWFARLEPSRAAGEQSPNDTQPLESATLTVLRDLHAAGVYTDAEFAAKKAELEKT